ncbi:uncharacterized protein LOC116919760 isoform X4 [Daphnia magna]|uniref:uncharacterized protein LOC116919760 isoform X4 n=1 Tax=Daphnia magna TaxID=35525 RepID=UPI001E1BC5CD|nr:uncharacterized protein LOC116919760 isoform X4 [Daphnia magna]
MSLFVMLETSLFRGEGSLKQNRTTSDGGRDCPTVLRVGNVVSCDLLFNINSRYPLCKYLPVLKKMADAEQPQLAEDFLFKGKRLDCKKKIFGYGSFLFDGYWKENENAGAEKEGVKLKAPNLKKEVAIRRIQNEDCLDGWKDVADKLIYLNHNNILRVFGYEEDVANGWRYFALEPYSATLYVYCNGWYNGPMPNESQVLYQITNGVSYLHGKRIVHGDLNPLNVVIAAQSRPVRMKISDFGLSKFSYSKQLSQKMKEGEKSFEMELCLRKYWYWTLSEETLEGIKDATEDFIAAGCILFYYLTRGEHLFGYDSKSILINLNKKNPVNLPRLCENHFAYEPIKNMINPPGKGFNWLQVANEEFKEALSLQVNTNKLLGSGTFGDVFEGKFNGDLVAVKQIKTTTAQKEIIQREMNTHIELNHVNVVKLLDVADSADNRFTQLALELCAGTLADWADEKKYNGPKLPPDELVLYQIANGLHYIHSRNLVHRDIKPENILISMTSPVEMKVSDLSFVKKTQEDIFSQSKIRGTLQWMAPERLKVLNDTENMPVNLPDGTIKSDTFSSGCVFFYFLTRGKHPFGKNQATVPGNILENKQEEIVNYKQNLGADDVNGRILAGLIEDMIQFEEKERIGLPEVIKQLAAVLYGMDKRKCQLRLVEASLGGKYMIRSHPTEPIFACANEEKLKFYTAENLAIPFSNWRKKKDIPFQHLNMYERVRSLEWNIDGTQLAAGFDDGTVVVWSYPECKIFFQKKLPRIITKINWNPTRPNLFAIWLYHQVVVCDSSNVDVITTIDCEKVTSVKWISENRIAVSSYDGKIEIFEIVENNLTTTRLVKEFTHGMSCRHLEWNERTQYLASGGDYQINIWSMDMPIPIKFPLQDSVGKFAWHLCTGNGEEEGGIEMARKSAKNFTFAYALRGKGVFIWNPLESEQQPRSLSKDADIKMLAFSSDGRFLVAGGDKKYMIWSAEDWVQIYELNNCTNKFDGPRNISFFTTKSTNLYENKLIVNYWHEQII